MAVREVLRYPDRRLRQRCTPVEDLAAAQDVIQDLCDTLQASGHGVGIAAPQIGELLRIIVIDCQAHAKKSLGLQVLINPVITASEAHYSLREGCMSLPDYLGPVDRARRITLEALSPTGEKLTLQAQKFEAVVIQHEIDHLDGVLFIDRVSSPRTQLLRRSELLKQRKADEA